jgi:branched-chain amino acid transport system substrate-binding protein
MHTIKTLLLLFAFSLFIYNCSPEPVKIGFSGPLSGQYADLGVQGRNGAMLAVEEINGYGGLYGTPLHLLIEDDYGTIEGALNADERLIRGGVRAIIGHMISSQSVAVLPFLKQNNMLLLSPTTSTPELNAIKDNFFRVHPSTDTAAASLAAYAWKRLGIKTVITIKDTHNAAYSRAFHSHFVKEFTSLGGLIRLNLEISSSANPDWKALIQQAGITSSSPLLIILSSRDAAAFTQSLKSLGLNPTILSSGWSMTGEFLSRSGRSAEGIILSAHTLPADPGPAYLHFEDNFFQRFGHKASFAAAYSYDAVRVLAQSLEIALSSRIPLYQAITNIQDFPGTYATFSINEYGDTVSPLYIIKVQNGRFEKIEFENRETIP